MRHTHDGVDVKEFDFLGNIMAVLSLGRSDTAMRPNDSWTRLYLLSAMMHPTESDELDANHLVGFEVGIPEAERMADRLNTRAMTLDDVAQSVEKHFEVDALLAALGFAEDAGGVNSGLGERAASPHAHVSLAAVGGKNAPDDVALRLSAGVAAPLWMWMPIPA